MKVTSPADSSVTEGHLCVKGRFGYEFVQLLPKGTPPPGVMRRGDHLRARVRRRASPGRGRPASTALFQAAGRTTRARRRPRGAPAASSAWHAAIALLLDPSAAAARTPSAGCSRSSWWSSRSCGRAASGGRRPPRRPRMTRDPRAVVEPGVGSKAAASSVAGILSSDADVVALQELTPDVAAAHRGRQRDQERYPYRILEPDDGVRGMGLLSRLPLTATHDDVRWPRIRRAAGPPCRDAHARRSTRRCPRRPSLPAARSRVSAVCRPASIPAVATPTWRRSGP